MVAIFGPSINTSQGMYSINPTATLKEVGLFALLTEYRMTLGPRRPKWAIDATRKKCGVLALTLCERDQFRVERSLCIYPRIYATLRGPVSSTREPSAFRWTSNGRILLC